MGLAWTVSTNRTLPAGLHVVTASGDNLTTGESCSVTMAFRTGGGGGGAQPDIQVSGSPSTSTPATGAMYSYTYRVRNNGSAVATAVGFTDVPPIELPPSSFQSVTTSSGAPCATAPVGDQLIVSCDLGDMAAGVQTSVTVTVTAPATPAKYDNTVTAYETNTDKNYGDNVKTSRSRTPRLEKAGLTSGLLIVPSTVSTAVRRRGYSREPLRLRRRRRLSRKSAANSAATPARPIVSFDGPPLSA